ncbi:MAG: hypothetical protein ACFFBD_04840 [Candidatus Hodarchaeota archaeon]
MKRTEIVKITLIIGIILVGFLPVQNTVASSWDYETTNEVLGAGQWYHWYGQMTAGTSVSGYFETSRATDTIDFFIADETNYNLYAQGSAAWVYSLKEDCHAAGFSGTIPYTATWHIMFSNRDGSSSVTVDMAVDYGTDYTPYYSGVFWDATANGLVLEPNEWFYCYTYCGTGSTLDASFKTYFSTDGLTAFFCDSGNFTLWSSGYIATVWNKMEDYHIATLSTFSVPYWDTWYVVFSADGQHDTVTFSAGVDSSGSGNVYWNKGSVPISPSTVTMYTTISYTQTVTTTVTSITTATPTTSEVATPGFEGIYLVVGLLTIFLGVIVVRRYKKQ